MGGPRVTRLLLHSGGLDSHICWLLDRTREPVYVAHGSGNQRRELDTLRQLAAHHADDDQPFGYSIVRGADLSRSVEADGHIAHRNAYLLLTAAMAFPKATEVAYGALRGEASADKSPRFVRAMERMLTESEGRQIDVSAPLLAYTKTQATVIGYRLAGAEALDLTWSCYHDGSEPCGRCQACYRRHLALWVAGRADHPPAALPSESKGPWANLRSVPLSRWPAMISANVPAARAMLAARRAKERNS